jgi:hypothetical protein
MKFHVHRASRSTHRPRDTKVTPTEIPPIDAERPGSEPTPVIDLREEAPERPDVSR